MSEPGPCHGNGPILVALVDDVADLKIAQAGRDLCAIGVPVGGQITPR